MIKIQLSNFSFVGTPAGELGLSNGVYELPEAYYVAVGTNSAVSLSNVVSGSTVVVDSAGSVLVADPPAITAAVVEGFVFGVGVLGMVIGLRWIWGKFVGVVVAGREYAGEN